LEPAPPPLDGCVTICGADYCP